jgi:NADPH:quinone reductase-like Zn-dependent oxidoreductase
MANTNQAAWLDGKDKQLRVGPADYPKPESDDIIVKNYAVAVNPVDCMLQ